MEEVSKSGGRTILFVSHQLEAIKQLCTSAILFRNGKLTKADNTEDVISEYLNSGKDELKSQNFNSEKEIYISGFQVKPLMEKHLYPGFSYEFEIQVLNRSSQEEKLHIGIGVNDKFGARLFTLYSRFNDEAFTIERGINVIKCELDKLILKPDIYNVHIYLGNGFETTDYIPGSLSFEVEPYPFFSKMMPDSSHGPMLLQHKWRINE
jgi:lipopolysaccharide transport system ATP-binding protein